MTNLLVQSVQTPLTINFPLIEQMTSEQFQEFCSANRDLHIERAATGEVVIMPPDFSDTGNKNNKISYQLTLWAEQDGTGETFDSSAGFTLPNGAVRSPDASWIRSERWNVLTNEQRASFAPICPDFVIELRSASDRLEILQSKLQEYIDSGAQLGFLIDRKARTVHVYRPDQRPKILENPAEVSAGPELPGFNLKMEKIW